MPPVWTDLAAAAVLVKDRALGHCPGGMAPTGFPGYYHLDEAQIARYLQNAQNPAAWRSICKNTFCQDI